jgi:hypothetical protein
MKWYSCPRVSQFSDSWSDTCLQWKLLGLLDAVLPLIPRHVMRTSRRRSDDGSYETRCCMKVPRKCENFRVNGWVTGEANPQKNVCLFQMHGLILCIVPSGGLFPSESARLMVSWWCFLTLGSARKCDYLFWFPDPEAPREMHLRTIAASGICNLAVALPVH